MSTQLAQLLRYLERDGVTEVVLAVGRPISMHDATGVSGLTARPLSSEQLQTIVRGTVIEPLISGEVQPAPIEIQFGQRRAHVVVTRRGDDITVSLKRIVDPVAPTEPPIEFEVDLSTQPPVRHDVRPAIDDEIELGAPIDESPAPPQAIDRHLASGDRGSEAPQREDGDSFQRANSGSSFQHASERGDGGTQRVDRGGFQRIDFGGAVAASQPMDREAAPQRSFQRLDLGSPQRPAPGASRQIDSGAQAAEPAMSLEIELGPPGGDLDPRQRKRHTSE